MLERMGKRQSTHLPAPLPAWVLAALTVAVLMPGALPGQTRYRVTRQENFRREAGPDGRRLAFVAEGAEVAGDSVEEGWVAVTLDGWIWGNSVDETSRDGFDVIVTPANGENLRVARNGAVVARVLEGFLADELERNGAWVRIRRRGWMWGRSLDPLDAPAGAPPPAQQPLPGSAGGGAAAPPPDAPVLEYTVTAGPTPLRRTPDGDTSGVLVDEAPVRVVERAGDWVKVQTTGWVREDELRPAASGVLLGVSGAEVRAQPDEFEGRLVQWTVQYVSRRLAEDLRRDLPAGRPYMLARGPVPESGFMYVLLSDEHAEALERVAPLAQLVIVARVRVGRSQYLGNPVLELVEMSVRDP